MAEYEDADGYVDASDAGLEVPPAPWQYDNDDDADAVDGNVEGGSGSASSSSGGGGESSGDYADNPELAYSQNWNSGADYNPYPAQDYSSQKLGSDPELVYYGAYQPGSPYYSVPEFQAGSNPYAMYTVAQMNENPELAYMPKPPILPDTPEGPVNPRGRGGGGARSYPSGPSIPPDALRAFVDMLRYGGLERI